MNGMIISATFRGLSRRVAASISVRSQGTAAIACSTNELHEHTLREPEQLTSTTHYGETRDFSPAALKRDDGDYYFEEHSEAMHSALSSAVQLPQEKVWPTASAYDMDLVEAAKAVKDHESYDKILILMRHGESEHNKFERKWVESGHSPKDANSHKNYPADPMLTGKGCGQMLALSRRTATFCKKETGLQPELFVVSPLRRAVQSALIAFPTHSAISSLDSIPWICHPMCMERTNGNRSESLSSASELKSLFPGVDYSTYEDMIDPGAANSEPAVPLFESKMDLLERTHHVLEWIKKRDERVIVVSSHATWLQSFCAFALQFQPEGKDLQMFKKGELRSVGIKFD